MLLFDQFGNAVGNLIPRRGDAVSLAADTTYTEERTLFVGGAGNVKVTTAGGDTLTYLGVLAGTFIPVAVTKVFSTVNGTTATNLIAHY